MRRAVVNEMGVAIVVGVGLAAASAWALAHYIEHHCSVPQPLGLCEVLIKSPPWAFLTGVAAAPAVLLTWYWRTTQKNEEIALGKAQESLAKRQERSTRFVEAVKLLAEGDKLEARLGAVYSLESLVRDSAEEHARVVETLCAFVRQHGVDVLEDGTAVKKQPIDVQAAFTTACRLGSGDARLLDFRESRLRGIEWTGPNGGVRIDLTNADLREAVFLNAWFLDSFMGGANLENADLQGARLDADLEGANFTNARLNDANLTSAALTSARLTGATLIATKFTDANLGSARLEGATFLDTDLERANLQNAHLEQARLTTCNLRDANLERAHLKGAVIAHADLRGARLGSADCEGVHFEAINLSEVDLSGTLLRHASYDSRTLFPKTFDASAHEMARIPTLQELEEQERAKASG
jgi:uncharacterized protein YjbI with pentapeptide repeats